jgi:hypothetical protein
MKKICTFTLAIILTVLAAADLGAQNLPSFETKDFGKWTSGAAMNSVGFGDCSLQSLFGQPPYLLGITGFPSATFPDGTTFMVVDNFSGIANPVAGVTFWGIFQNGLGEVVVPAAPMHFRIYFFGDFVGGDTLYRADLYLTAQSELTGGMPVCRFDASFPAPVNLPANGYFSVIQVIEPGPDFFSFYWIASMNGDMMSTVYLIQFGMIINSDLVPFDWAFCMNQDLAQEVPLYNWAVIIGLLLIMVTFFIRYRKYSV